MYEVIETSLANTDTFYQFKRQDFFGIAFNLKGFQNPWILATHKFQSGECVLDVGGGYSQLPIHIQKEYGCETWIADDFGYGDGYDWKRFFEPKEYIEEHKDIKFVLELVGNQEKSSLPKNYFDVIYSVSVLEHVPYEFSLQVWKHMADLLKPGGELIHTVEFYFPSNLGWLNLLKISLAERLSWLVPKSLMEKLIHRSPAVYIRMIFKALGIKKRVPRNLFSFGYIIDPEIMVENYEIGWNRIYKDDIDYEHRRVGAILIHLKKLA